MYTHPAMCQDIHIPGTGMCICLHTPTSTDVHNRMQIWAMPMQCADQEGKDNGMRCMTDQEWSPAGWHTSTAATKNRGLYGCMGCVPPMSYVLLNIVSTVLETCTEGKG